MRTGKGLFCFKGMIKIGKCLKTENLIMLKKRWYRRFKWRFNRGPTDDRTVREWLLKRGFFIFWGVYAEIGNHELFGFPGWWILGKDFGFAYEKKKCRVSIDTLHIKPISKASFLYARVPLNVPLNVPLSTILTNLYLKSTILESLIIHDFLSLHIPLKI